MPNTPSSEHITATLLEPEKPEDVKAGGTYTLRLEAAGEWEADADYEWNVLCWDGALASDDPRVQVTLQDSPDDPAHVARVTVKTGEKVPEIRFTPKAPPSATIAIMVVEQRGRAQRLLEQFHWTVDVHPA